MARGQTTFYANLGITPRERKEGAKQCFDLTLCTFINGHPHVVVTADELAWIGQAMIQMAGENPAAAAPAKPKMKTVTVTVSLDDDDDGLDMV